MCDLIVARDSPIPRVDLKEYDIIIWVLGGAHNLMCGVVLMTYFLSNHPTLPSISGMVKTVKYAARHSMLIRFISRCRLNEFYLG
jgi:hypothetical protein